MTALDSVIVNGTQARPHLQHLDVQYLPLVPIYKFLAVVYTLVCACWIIALVLRRVRFSVFFVFLISSCVLVKTCGVVLKSIRLVQYSDRGEKDVVGAISTIVSYLSGALTTSFVFYISVCWDEDRFNSNNRATRNIKIIVVASTAILIVTSIW